MPASSRLTKAVLLAVLVAAIRVAALPLRGTEDVLTWKIWAIAASRDVTAVYGVGGHPPVRGELKWLHHTTTVDYPSGTAEVELTGWKAGEVRQRRRINVE